MWALLHISVAENLNSPNPSMKVSNVEFRKIHPTVYAVILGGGGQKERCSLFLKISYFCFA
jgi:hypothetical protein